MDLAQTKQIYRIIFRRTAQWFFLTIFTTFAGFLNAQLLYQYQLILLGIKNDASEFLKFGIYTGNSLIVACGLGACIYFYKQSHILYRLLLIYQIAWIIFFIADSYIRYSSWNSNELLRFWLLLMINLSISILFGIIYLIYNKFWLNRNDQFERRKLEIYEKRKLNAHQRRGLM
ncbi:hypothetical protein FGO68_gene1502 [Halteria grandinella]|uniref:Uncharacterized protein n=1 Tax=Halteria grandinella TaxID=5974 RepID=A0A8J8T075_HALGN|nr:hypothetical protein FGO68_gene1502 [Halteria grandinella]